MEELKKALLALGVPQAKVEALAAENKPEDFDTSKEIKAIAEDREQFFVQKNKKAIQDAYEEEVKGDRYAATVKPLMNRISRKLQEYGVSSDEVKDLGAKEMLDHLFTKSDEVTANASNVKDEALIKQVNELKTLYSNSDQRVKELEAAQPAFEKQVEEKYANLNKATKIDGMFRNLLTDEEFKQMKKVGNPTKVLKLYMEDAGYGLDLDVDNTGRKRLKPVMKDGTAAMDREANRVYDSVKDMVIDVARKNYMFPEHNGGEGDVKLSTEQVINGKTVNVGEGANWLAKNLG